MISGLKLRYAALALSAALTMGVSGSAQTTTTTPPQTDVQKDQKDLNKDGLDPTLPDGAGNRFGAHHPRDSCCHDKTPKPVPTALMPVSASGHFFSSPP